MTTRVYCEHGAFRNELYQLQGDGRIELINFPYEMKIEKKHQKAKPSNAKIADLGHAPLAEAHWPLAEFKGSEKLAQIRQILGKRTRRDALHVDSVYKSGCDAFMTRDSRHILAKAQALEELLGMKFFHPDGQWEEFVGFVDSE
jgi:hypothetical protein